jgi:hypothetical protein
MTLPSLSDLVPVPLRDVWADEAAFFTPWLAKSENLKRLGDTLGIELELEDEEVAVGPFSADILCKDTADGSWVVIENQIEKTDHRHLGQILTYAAGLGAKTLVWVAAKFTDEHRAALDWLNEHTNEEISFFALEIEVWRIGNSSAAPKFNIVSKPNDWAKTVKMQASASSENRITEHKQLQFEFWTEFKKYVEDHSKIKLQKPRYQHWTISTIGRSGFHLSAITSAWNTITGSFGIPEVRVELTLNSRSAKDQFSALEASKDEIQSKITLPLTWHKTEANSCKIFVRRDGDFTDGSKWKELFEWLLKYLEEFNAVFRPIIQNI